MKDPPPEWPDSAKSSPYWNAMTAMALSLGYDVAVVNLVPMAALGRLLGGVRHTRRPTPTRRWSR
jgi:hypothetical protein